MQLTLRKDPAMVFEFLGGIRCLRWIDQPANLDDRLEIRAFQEADAIVGWKHESCLSPILKKWLDVHCRRPDIALCRRTTIGSESDVMFYVISSHLSRGSAVNA